MKLLNHFEARQKLRRAIGMPLGTLICLIVLYMAMLELPDSFYHLYKIKQLEQGVQQTLATIISCQSQTPSKGKNYYLCDYHYTVADETGQPQMYSGESTYPTSVSAKKEQGDLIAIVYAQSDHSVSIIIHGRTHFNDSYLSTGVGIIMGLIGFLGGIFATLACGWISYYFVKDWIAVQAKGSFYQETAQPVSQMALLKAFLFEDGKEGMLLIGLLIVIILFAWLFFTGQMR